jgi:transcriptional regulator with XRE-family HTH domain
MTQPTPSEGHSKTLRPACPEDDSRLAKRLRKLRGSRGWTLEHCEVHGFKNWRHLQELESGKNLTLETLVKLARLYKMSPSKLLSGL